MNKNQLKKLVLVLGTICLSVGNVAAQDTLTVNMGTLYFEYDENNSIVKEELVVEELEDSLETETLAKRRGAAINMEQERHLFLSGQSESAMVTAIIDRLADYSERVLEVHSLSGVPIFSADITQSRTTFDLSTLPQGIYIVTLTLDGRKENRKIIRR
jgi:hypothetical protein